MKTRLLHILALAAIAALLAWKLFSTFAKTRKSDYPNRPIDVVVPYPAGGGADVFVRVLEKTIAGEQLLEAPLVVRNRPGGSGTIGSRYVKDARPDGYRILCHHESIITAELSGIANFGPKNFEPIARTGGIVLLILVREDAPFETVADLLKAAKAKPRSIRFGANPGSPAHFTAMRLEAALPGARFNLVNSGGGQTRYSSLIGGHLEAGIFSLAEYIKFRLPDDTPPAENIRVLATLSETSHPTLPESPTCLEAGIEVTSSNSYYWWAPEGTPPDVIDKLATTLETAMQHEKVRAELSELSIGFDFTRGEDLDSWIDSRIAALEPLSVRAQLALPNFPLIAAVILAGLGLFIFVSKSKRDEIDSTPDFPVRIRAGIFSLGILFIWILVLQFEFVPFAFSTSAMIFLIGAVIADWEKRRLPSLAEIALLTALGSEIVFRQLFNVALP